MSDTLQEREDQIANEEADERTFQRIRRARLIGNPNQNADWCDDCHGYTHMPYCPSYEPPETEANQLLPDGISSVSAGSEHQPAARGGGDDGERVRQIQKRVEIGYSRISQDLEDPYTLGERLDDTEYLVNQHQSLTTELDALKSDSLALVAEREQWERLKSKIAWHRDGAGPDVPVLQERYDRVIKERDELRVERERLIVAAKAVVERLADLPRYLEKNDVPTLATMTAECLADLAVAIPAEQRSTSE